MRVRVFKVFQYGLILLFLFVIVILGDGFCGFFVVAMQPFNSDGHLVKVVVMVLYGDFCFLLSG